MLPPWFGGGQQRRVPSAAPSFVLQSEENQEVRQRVPLRSRIAPKHLKHRIKRRWNAVKDCPVLAVDLFAVDVYE